MRPIYFALLIFSFTAQNLNSQSADYEALLTKTDYLVEKNSSRYGYIIENYTQCIKLEPEDYRPYFGRSTIYLKKREYKLAYEDIQIALALNPANLHLSSLAIQILMASGEKDKANDFISFVNSVPPGEIPDFSILKRIEFLNRVNTSADKKMEAWLVKDQFEKTDMYQQRISEPNRIEKFTQFQNEAIKELASSIPGVTQLRYHSFDADNEAFVLKNNIFGDLIFVIPLAEARSFKEAIPTMQLYILKCDIDDEMIMKLQSCSLQYGGKTTIFNSNENSGYYESINSTIQFRELNEITSNDEIKLGPTGSRLALVIGNGDYIHGGKLLNPENDAQSIEATLKKLEFTVMKYENLDLSLMRKVIDDFGNELRKYDIGLFFYAGHGIQVNGENYLVPVDANLNTENDVSYNCVNAGRVLAKMEDARNPTNMIILDACRDNPFERSWTRSTKGNGLAFMNAPAGSMIAYATSPGLTASDGTGSNGLYTSAILKFIDSPNLSVLEMFQEVRRYVRTQSNGQQTPWESTSLEGNFFFVPTDN
ncbi:caspase family protein [Bacteroidota bacterium]